MKRGSTVFITILIIIIINKGKKHVAEQLLKNEK